jgi:hypothetical protein
LIVLCLVGGLAVPILELGYRSNPNERALFEFVREHRRPGEVYLVPVELPKARPNERGVRSSNFMPAPTRGRAGEFIAGDLQQFRLETGAPIYVDFKAIPYKDAEVLEWYRRVLWCTKAYEPRSGPNTAVRAEMISQGITHVVVPVDNASLFAGLGAPQHRDETYAVFQVIP